MNIYILLLELCGAVALLLWAVRMVRTGVERSYEPLFRRLLGSTGGPPLRAPAIGVAVATVLQSSTAVALLAAGLVGSGIISVATGLALMLGADLGSALAVRLLSVRIDWLVPLLLLAGGVLFHKGPSRRMRQGGRILIGIALVLVSLRMLGEATAPLRELPSLPTAIDYLSGDALTTFLLGALFTWLLHSSVASILLFATMAGQGIVPLDIGVPLVLGANLGGGLVAMGLTRAGELGARRITAGNMLFRAIGAAAALAVTRLIPLDGLGADPATQMITLHIVFNAALLLCLPLTRPASRLVDRLVRPPALPAELPEAASFLDQNVLDTPRLALASAKRELLRMAEVVERMLAPLMELYETGDADRIRQVRLLEQAVDHAQSEIKLYLARIEYSDGLIEELSRGRDLASFAINLEYVGDAVSKTLMKLAETRRDQALTFSPAGWRELNELHRRVLRNMRLALNVLMSEDRESARQLVAEKEAMRQAETASARTHLERLRQGTRQSIETSNLHLETVRALRTINSLFASVAYPILSSTGDLLGSRLIASERRSR